jgi:hypothetical protein
MIPIEAPQRLLDVIVPWLAAQADRVSPARA